MTAVEVKLRDFESQILFFNGMYKLPIASYPTVFKIAEAESERRTVTGWSAKDYLIRRISDFMSIMKKEVIEGDDIIAKLKTGVHEVGKLPSGNPVYGEYTELDCLTDLADWLVDMQIYCASEMVKYGIPVKDSQRIVMSSNFSKLGANGEPIYDDEGKVQKGPGYWKPEPQLNAMLAERIEEVIQVNKPVLEDGIVWRVEGK